MATGMTLVTGATGFAGSHLLDRLAGHGRLVAWHRPGRPAPQPTPNIDWRPVDLLDGAGVRDAVRAAGALRIYHLAGAARADTAWQSVVPHLRANVVGTHHLLGAVREAGLPCRVLVVTSAMIYQSTGRPIDEDTPLLPSGPYGVSKLAQDELARRAFAEDGLDVVIARPFNHAGPRQGAGFVVSSFARQIALAETGAGPREVRVGNLDACRDLSDVRDVVEAYERLMAGAPAGRPYNICSGRVVRVGDLLDELLRLARVPLAVSVEAGRLRPGDATVFAGNPARAAAEVGWSARTPVATTLRDTLEWWRTTVGAAG